jgi:orotate phosphoribosyltransferase
MIISVDEVKVSSSFCKEYINKYCIWRGKPGERIPAKEPGYYYSWQFYLRRGLFNSDFIHHLTRIFLYKIEKEIGHFDFQISGMETAATPMITGIMMSARYQYGIDFKGFIVRKEEKEYGLRNWIEGIASKDTPILLMDDLCNSANSIYKCYYILNHFEYDLLGYTFTIVNKTNKEDFEKKKNDKYFEKDGIEDMKFISAFTLDSFGLKL